MNGVIRESGYFWLHRCRSLAGMLLAAAYLLLFLLPSTAILKGPAAYDAAMGAIAGFGPINGIVVLALAAFAIFAVGIGLFVLHASGSNLLAYPRAANAWYLVRRVAGLIAVAAAGYYVFGAALRAVVGGQPLTAARMQMLLQPVGGRALAIAGVLAAAVLIGNGATIAAMRWGIAAAPRARNAAAILGWTLAVLVGAWGLAVVLAF